MTGPDLTLIVLLVCGGDGATPGAEVAASCAADDRRAPDDGSLEDPPTQDAQASQRRPKEVFYGVTLGAGFNQNYPDGEFFKFAVWKPGTHGVTFDVGEQHADDESTIAAGVTYWRNLDSKTAISVNAGGGTRPFAPQAWVGGSISHPFGTIGFTLGANYQDWRDGSYTAEVGLGAQRWFPHWIVGGGATYSRGQPASIVGWRGNVGLTYYVWRKTYVGVGVDFGEVRYREWRYDTRSQGINVGLSQWFNGNSSINLSAGGGFDNDIRGFSVSYYREW